jgi:heme-degrading monooxygenase HmoA
MTTMSTTSVGLTGSGAVTLVNVFEIHPDEVDFFIEGWAERAKLMSKHPGFRDTRLHRALTRESRFQLINVAHWDNAKSYVAARKDPAFQLSREHIARGTPRVTSNAELYRVVVGYVIPSCGNEPFSGPLKA